MSPDSSQMIRCVSILAWESLIRLRTTFCCRTPQLEYIYDSDRVSIITVLSSCKAKITPKDVHDKKLPKPLDLLGILTYLTPHRYSIFSPKTWSHALQAPYLSFPICWLIMAVEFYWLKCGESLVLAIRSSELVELVELIFSSRSGFLSPANQWHIKLVVQGTNHPPLPIWKLDILTTPFTDFLICGPHQFMGLVVSGRVS